jgi:cytochrome c-type biogenesis protein CcmH
VKKLTLLLAVLCFSGLAAAVEPQEMLKDPALEARAREVSKLLRCVQCQNETIDDSHAEIARDMRVLVRERITAGDSNQQILDYMTSRYGDYVRLRPRFMASTLVLWIGPFIILIFGGFVVASRFRQAGGETMPLTEEEEAIIATYKDTGEKTS